MATEMATQQNDKSQSGETRQLHPRELLRQVTNSMNGQYNDLSVTVPAHTSWKAAIRAAEEALGDVDKPIVLMPPRSYNRQLLRQIALQDVRRLDESSPQTRVGLHIRSSIDLATLKRPTPRTQEARNLIREIAKEAAKEEFRMPYVLPHESYLPIVTADLVLRGVDGDDEDPIAELNGVSMIWDTGAHRTIIADEILPPEFRKYLESPVHDPYRSRDGLSLQVDAGIALSNCAASISAVALVVPKTKMPNEMAGILFGQRLCIDQLSYHSIPRLMLLAKGEDVAENLWGDIIATEYLNADGDIVSL